MMATMGIMRSSVLVVRMNRMTVAIMRMMLSDDGLDDDNKKRADEDNVEGKVHLFFLWT